MHENAANPLSAKAPRALERRVPARQTAQAAVAAPQGGKLMSRSRMLLWMLPLLLPTMAFGRAPLVDPPPIAVPDNLNTMQVAKVVKAALIGRGWQVSAEQANGVDGTLHGNDYTAQIHVAFDNRKISITYVDSKNLKYEVKSNGQRMIHSNYMNWMRFLTQDIGRNLQLVGSS
jgi:hypothetical protein